MSRPLALVPLCAFLISCLTRGGTAVRHPHVDDGFTAAEVKQPPGLEPARPAPFHLVVGDVVEVRTMGTEALPPTVASVGDDEHLDLPIVGRVRVGGLTPGQAGETVETALRRWDRFARASVVVVEARGHRATVVGAVAKPGVMSLLAGTRVAELVAMAGGFRNVDSDGEVDTLADVEGARLVRGSVPLPISLTQALAGDVRHNVPVEAGDLLYVPARVGAAIRVLGEVKTPRLVPFRAGLSLTEVLVRAGGANRDGNLAAVRVIRGPLSSPRVYQVSLEALLEGKASDVTLAAGDVVYVSREWFATVTDMLQRLTPLIAGAALATAIAQ